MVYLSSAPRSHAVFDFATGCFLAEAAEDNLARHVHGGYPQQGCGLAGYDNIRHTYWSGVPSKKTINRTIHLSDRQGIRKQSTALMVS